MLVDECLFTWLMVDLGEELWRFLIVALAGLIHLWGAPFHQQWLLEAARFLLEKMKQLSASHSLLLCSLGFDPTSSKVNGIFCTHRFSACGPVPFWMLLLLFRKQKVWNLWIGFSPNDGC
uniref:Uncharacterized protein n=1 Tax=Arundo donax TaxID=35708 RepID=A0A0A9D3P6_ARUDO